MRRLLVLASGCVILAGCLGGDREAPAERCLEAADADCIETEVLVVEERVTVGPGTYRWSGGSPYVFDVPAGMRVAVSHYDVRDLMNDPRTFDTPLPPTFLVLGDAVGITRWVEIEDVATSSVLRIDPRTGEEWGRDSRNPDTGESIHPVRTSGSPITTRAIVDARMGHWSTRYPTDYLSLVPDVPAAFARVPADGLLDRIVASIRIAE